MFRYICLFVLCLSLNACHHKSTKENIVFYVEKKSDKRHLYYQGVVKPINEELIISPTGGIVTKINFHYGDFARKGDLLLTIRSPQMENEFREAMINYLKIKQAYLNSKKSMTGTEILYKEKIISEEEYFNEESQYQVNFMNYIEASNKLKQYLMFIPSFKQELIDQSLSHLNDMKKILQQDIKEIFIFAPSSGIILFSEEKDPSNLKLLQIGSQVKKDDMLLTIGDLSGLSIKTYVHENDICQLSVGMPVNLTFQSDLETELQGNIVSIAKQAINNGNADLTLFPIVMNVSKMTSYQLGKIYIGMNAKIDIIIQEHSSIRIPIKAVFQKENKNLVTVVDPKTNRMTDREVVTGRTSLEDVIILEGLSNGEKIIVHD